ncbi:MAG: 50S ribosomal protein L17 [Saprospiraceae bacterium]|jgi:large subunit ribosomal protein L17
MRHGNKVNPLGRKAAHRHALMSNLASALIEHKRITTTIAKARELRKYIEPLVTKARQDSTHNRRVVFSYLQNKESVKELFGPISEKIGDRPGGYVRIIKLGFRKNDAAEIALIEFVDFNEVYNVEKAGQKAGASKRRGRRGGKGKGTDAETTVVASGADAAPSAEPPVVDAEYSDDQPAQEDNSSDKG